MEHVETSVVAVRDVQNLAQMERMAELLSQSGFFKEVKDVAQAFVKVQAGKELGIPPVASMRGIDVFDGQVSLRAHLMASMIKSSGRYRYTILEHTSVICRLAFHELVLGTWELMGESEFTREQAQAAELLGKKNWKQYTKAMLYNRAMAEGARYYCPDLFFGAVYDAEELEQVPVESAPAESTSADEADPVGQYLEERAVALARFEELVALNSLPSSRIRAFFEPLGITDRTKMNLAQIYEAIQHINDHRSNAFPAPQDTSASPTQAADDAEHAPGKHVTDGSPGAPESDEPLLTPYETFRGLAQRIINTIKQEDVREALRSAIATEIFHVSTWAHITALFADDSAPEQATMRWYTSLLYRIESQGVPQLDVHGGLQGFVRGEIKRAQSLQATAVGGHA